MLLYSCTRIRLMFVISYSSMKLSVAGNFEDNNQNLWNHLKLIRMSCGCPATIAGKHGRVYHHLKSFVQVCTTGGCVQLQALYSLYPQEIDRGCWTLVNILFSVTVFFNC